MNRRELLLQVASCGLDCGRCLNNPGSPVARHARSLRAALGRFGEMARGFADMDSVFAGYPDFERVLERLCSGGCSGCRAGSGLLPQCAVRDCVRGRGLDFCHECPEFPCDETGLPPSLLGLWRTNNQRLREVGFTAYLGELRAKPRY
ncbi:DUF3795 domain-containing protein [Desulfocurvus sp. DL9XJH121]